MRRLVFSRIPVLFRSLEHSVDAKTIFGGIKYSGGGGGGGGGGEL